MKKGSTVTPAWTRSCGVCGHSEWLATYARPEGRSVLTVFLEQNSWRRPNADRQRARACLPNFHITAAGEYWLGALRIYLPRGRINASRASPRGLGPDRNKFKRWRGRGKPLRVFPSKSSLQEDRRSAKRREPRLTISVVRAEVMRRLLPAPG